MAQPAYFNTIDQFLNQLTTEQHFSGSVLVATKDGVFKKGYGLADRDLKTPVAPTTVLETGSVTKQFTGAAILKLEMMGKLSVQDPIGKYFNNVPPDKSGITLHHLLTHSSGIIPNIVDDYTSISREEYVSKALQAPLSFQPGTAYDYSNAGYSLLAAVIEIVTGEPYEAFLNRYLFQPAGMKNTGYLMPGWDQNNVAAGYRGDQRWGKPNEKPWASDGPYWNLRGNGGILSTVEDLYLWHQALSGDQILDQKAKEKYYARHIEEGEGAGTYYGYGWALFPTPRNTWLVTHNGGNGIFFCDFLRYLEEEVTIIVMCNAMQRHFHPLAGQIARAVFIPGYQPALPNSVKDVPVAGLDEHPQGGLIKNFLQTISSGNDEAIRAFVQQHFTRQMIGMAPMETHLKLLKSAGNDLKGKEIAEIKVNGEETRLSFKDVPLRATILIAGGKIAGMQLED